MPKLGEVRVCVFDAYGTLFDFASATRGCGDLLEGAELEKLTALCRDKQLQYTWLRAIQERHAVLGCAPVNWFKIILTYCVPYAVSTYGAVSVQIRQAASAGGSMDALSR